MEKKGDLAMESKFNPTLQRYVYDKDILKEKKKNKLQKPRFIIEIHVGMTTNSPVGMEARDLQNMQFFNLHFRSLNVSRMSYILFLAWKLGP